jgi:hypothetical protein
MRCLTVLLILALGGCYNSPVVERLNQNTYSITTKTDTFSGGGQGIPEAMTGRRAFQACPNGYTEIEHAKLPGMVEKTTIKCL